MALDLAGTEVTNLSAGTYVNLGWVLLQEGDRTRAASHFSDVARVSSLIRAQDIALLRERLGENFKACYAEGQAMSHREIVRLASGAL
jgi:hypothetical protein